MTNNKGTYTKLFRYTSLPVALDVLLRKKLTLVDPAQWEDRNDSDYLIKYKEAYKLKSLLAVCFAQSLERYHYWKVFAGNNSGACIIFNKSEVIGQLARNRNLLMQDVEYSRSVEVEQNVTTHELLFHKRMGFEDEREFRIIYKNKTTTYDRYSINLNNNCIDRVLINPWVSDELVNTIQEVIRTIPGCEYMPVSKSYLVEDSGWSNVASMKLKYKD